MRELLSLKNLRLQGPLTFADTSTAPFSGMPNHWDIGFIFTAEREAVPSSGAWDELRFVDVNKLKHDEIVRSQVDVLTYAGKLKLKQ